MNSEDYKFTELTYQDFYEDKILLMEYDMTPEWIVKGKMTSSFMDEIIINHQKYCFYYDFNKYCKGYSNRYVIQIYFSLKELRRCVNPNSIIQIKENWCKNGDLFNIGYSSFILTYTHSILLNWEEITDKRYLNFIIDSFFEYLKEQIEKSCICTQPDKFLEFMKKFKTTILHTIYILYT